MEEKNTNVDFEAKPESKDEKREFINIAVTKEQKNAISKEAIVNCGISVSEYCRTKILAPKPEVQEETIFNTVNDEEREIFEEGMKQSAERERKKDEIINKQAEEIIALKSIVSGTSDIQETKPVIAESSIVLELTPEQRQIIDLAIKLESESFFGANYSDLKHFIKKQLGDLVTSNQSGFPNEYFEKDKPEYKTAFDFIKFLKENPTDGN